MTNPYWKEGGGFIPFRFPIATPDDAIGDTPLHCVSFNLGWRKYILGALACLARPETWQTDDPFIAEGAALEGQELLERVASGTGCEDEHPHGDPTWECHYDFTLNDGGWELWPDSDGDWGEYNTGVGWSGTVGYNTSLSQYVRRLRIKKVYASQVLVTTFAYQYIHTIELVGGGAPSRTLTCRGVDDTSHLNMLVNVETHLDQYHSWAAARVYYAQPVLSVYFDGFAGIDNASNLETSEITVSTLDVRGIGDSPDC